MDRSRVVDRHEHQTAPVFHAEAGESERDNGENGMGESHAPRRPPAERDGHHRLERAALAQFPSAVDQPEELVAEVCGAGFC
jgi:hypothetical protein